MVTYSVEEDRLLLQLRYELSSCRGPDWTGIKNRFNTEFSHKKYTIAMLRNRLARIDKSRVKKKARNRCGICGELLAGHTCKRIQVATDYICKKVPEKVPEKVIKVANSNPRRQGVRKRIVKRAVDFSYRTETTDDDLEVLDNMELPTEAEISEAFMTYGLPPLCLK